MGGKSASPNNARKPWPYCGRLNECRPLSEGSGGRGDQGNTGNRGGAGRKKGHFLARGAAGELGDGDGVAGVGHAAGDEQDCQLVTQGHGRAVLISFLKERRWILPVERGSFRETRSPLELLLEPDLRGAESA